MPQSIGAGLPVSLAGVAACAIQADWTRLSLLDLMTSDILLSNKSMINNHLLAFLLIGLPPGSRSRHSFMWVRTGICLSPGRLLLLKKSKAQKNLEGKGS